MKKMIEIEVCDNHNDDKMWYHCRICNKNLCYKCFDECLAKKYNHGMGTSGTMDGIYCSECLNNYDRFSDKESTLLYWYMNMIALKEEEKWFLKSFEEKVKANEDNIKTLWWELNKP